MSQKEKKIICNQCGKEIDSKDQSDFLEIKKSWGYFSKEKDGQLHHIILCEDCYEKWILGFSIPPEVTEITEYL